MSTPKGLLVTAYLSSPLAQDPPMLDAICERVLAGTLSAQDAGAIQPERMGREFPAPPPSILPISISRREIGGWQVPLCSAPILGKVHTEAVEHINKRIGVENAPFLAEKSRTVVATTNGWTKSYRLPMRIRLVDCVRWVCFANRRELWKQIKNVPSLSKKRSVGYGEVHRWEIADYEGEHWWYAPSEQGQVLMRPLPLCDQLPKDLVGYKRDFGSVVGPFWHPDRYIDRVVPC